MLGTDSFPLYHPSLLHKSCAWSAFLSQAGAPLRQAPAVTSHIFLGSEWLPENRHVALTETVLSGEGGGRAGGPAGHRTGCRMARARVQVCGCPRSCPCTVVLGKEGGWGPCLLLPPDRKLGPLSPEPAPAPALSGAPRAQQSPPVTGTLDVFSHTLPQCRAFLAGSSRP